MNGTRKTPCKKLKLQTVSTNLLCLLFLTGREVFSISKKKLKKMKTTKKSQIESKTKLNHETKK